MGSAHDEQSIAGESAATDDLRKLRYLNTVMMANFLLRQLRIPLYIHVDHVNKQILVVADNGIALAEQNQAIYTGPLDYNIDE